MMGGKHYSEISAALDANDVQRAGQLVAHWLADGDTAATRSAIARAIAASTITPQVQITLTGFGHIGLLADALTAYGMRERVVADIVKMDIGPPGQSFETPVLHLVRIESETDNGALRARLATFPKGRILLVPDPGISVSPDYDGFEVLDTSSSWQQAEWIDPRKLGDDLSMLTALATKTLAGSVITDLVSWLETADRPACKIIFTDLDNTLWGGILGEDGAEGLYVGSTGPVDFRRYQLLLKKLSSQGVLLAAVSRNRPEDVEQAFSRRRDMELTMDDFLTIEAGWGPKSETIARVLSHAQVAPEAAVFIDDDPLERGQVALGIPGLLVPCDGDQPDKTLARLIGSGLFSAQILPEDQARRQSTRASMRIKTQLQLGEDRIELLKSLNIRVSFEPLNTDNEQRARQLADRVTQFRTAATPDDWYAPDKHVILTRLRETGMDHGRIGLVIWRQSGNTAVIELFCLSCRALNRDIETAMIAETIRHAKAAGLEEIEAGIEDLSRNEPARDLFVRHGFERLSPSLFQRNLHDMAVPDHVAIDAEGAGIP